MITQIIIDDSNGIRYTNDLHYPEAEQSLLAEQAMLNSLFPRLDYCLSKEAVKEWELYINSFSGIRISKKIWAVLNATQYPNSKYNAGASQNVDLDYADVKVIQPNGRSGVGVKVNVRSILIDTNVYKVLFTPSDIIIKNGKTKLKYRYEDINVYPTTTRFVERGRPAKDAVFVENTWQYVNCDGTPDRRFRDNYQVPVYLYGELVFWGNRFCLTLGTSNKNVTWNAAVAFQRYKEYVMHKRLR